VGFLTSLFSKHEEQPSVSDYYKNEPAGIREHLLNQAALQSADFETSRKLSEESDRIAQEQLDRNLAGIQAEKQGDIDTAIAKYERNVGEMSGGNHPYERLRIIYRRRKQYDDAIRVCQRFVQMADRLIELGSPRSDLQRKRDHFQEWINKMTEQRTRT
jgi:hypothetical protein